MCIRDSGVRRHPPADGTGDASKTGHQFGVSCHRAPDSGAVPGFVRPCAAAAGAHGDGGALSPQGSHGENWPSFGRHRDFFHHPLRGQGAVSYTHLGTGNQKLSVLLRIQMKQGAFPALVQR